MTDGGGEALAARRPILGRDRIVRFFAGLLAKAPPGIGVVSAEANGIPAIVVHQGDALIQVGQLVVDAEGRIAELLFVVAPSKLAYVRRQGLRVPEC